MRPPTLWLGFVLGLALVAPTSLPGSSVAVAQPTAALAKPDERLTLRVREVDLPALLQFLAKVGGTSVTLAPDLQGVVRGIDFDQVRVEDALQQVLLENRLTWRHDGKRLVIQQGPLLPSFPPVPAIDPDPMRPELIVPPRAP